MGKTEWVSPFCSSELSRINFTIGPSILFPLHFLAILVQLLVRQLVEGIGRFWLCWDCGWADWRLTHKQWHKITALTLKFMARKRENMFWWAETAIYRRTVLCYDAGEHLRLWPCCLHVLTILLSDLKRQKFNVRIFCIHVKECGRQRYDLYETK